MHPSRIPCALALPILLLLSSCGYVHVGRLPVPVTQVTVVGDEKLMQEASDLRVEKKILQQELALTRAQGEALRHALQNRAADGDTSQRLVEKLNQTTRELATLRSSYVQLQTEKNQAVATAAEASALKARLGATEEKLAASLRTYTELQDEVVRLRSDVDRTRTENVALGEQVKAVTAQNEQAQAALAQLNTDLLAQKDARFRAEQDAETLRTELKAVAPNASALAQLRTGAAADARSLVAEQAAEAIALKEQLATLKTQVAGLTAERATLQKQLGATETPRASTPDLVQAAQTMREQLRAAQAQAAALTEENSRLKARVVRPPEVVEPAGANTIVVGAPPPRPSGVNATLVTGIPGVQRSNGKPDATPAVQGDAGANGRFHVVAGGDTLAKISTQYYGTPGRWGDILAANREVLGENNNLIVGRTLRIP